METPKVVVKRLNVVTCIRQVDARVAFILAVWYLWAVYRRPTGAEGCRGRGAAGAAMAWGPDRRTRPAGLLLRTTPSLTQDQRRSLADERGAYFGSGLGNHFSSFNVETDENLDSLQSEDPDENKSVSSESGLPLKTQKNLKDGVSKYRTMLTEPTCRRRGWICV